MRKFKRGDVVKTTSRDNDLDYTIIYIEPEDYIGATIYLILESQNKYVDDLLNIDCSDGMGGVWGDIKIYNLQGLETSWCQENQLTLVSRPKDLSDSQLPKACLPGRYISIQKLIDDAVRIGVFKDLQYAKFIEDMRKELDELVDTAYHNGVNTGNRVL